MTSVEPATLSCMILTAAAACPACGAAGGLGLFVVVFGVFILMFLGTVLLFVGAAGRGEWRSQDLRSAALVAEQMAAEQVRDEPASSCTSREEPPHDA
jgi:hypothetical protein